jgi:hypothetical protein
LGVGDSLEAAYDLKASVPAGAYHCIIDAIIIRPVDVTFDLIWRSGDTDMVLATWDQHFDPNPGANFDAQPYELDVDAPAIDFSPGDQFVFRYSATNTSEAEAFIPNGDGTLADGRIPNFTFPTSQ